MLYQSVGIQGKLAVPPCRNIITQSQIARLPVHKLWEVVGELGMITHALLCGHSFSTPHGQTPSGVPARREFGFAGVEVSGGHQQGRNPEP